MSECFSSGLFSLSPCLSALFIMICGKLWGKVQLKDEKVFFLNNLLFGQSDARVDVREVAEEQELL